MKRAKRSEAGPPQFVGIDGEGVNQPGGDQWYTLLCMVGPTGPHGEEEDNYEEQLNNGGVSTEDCFRFLLDHSFWRRNVYVSFFFNYDVTKMLRDLDDAHRVALHAAGWVLWTGPSGKRYFIRHIPSKIFVVGEFVGRVEAGKAPSEFRDLSRKVRIYDTSGFFQKSFAKSLEEWKFLEGDDLAFIERMKSERNDFQHVDPAEIRRYCLMECRYLVKLMNRLAAALWEAGIYLRSWHGAGAVAEDLMHQHKVQRYIAPPPEEANDAVMGSYFGGRMEVFRQGYVPGGVLNYDLQSAYPSAAISLPDLGRAVWRRVRAYQREEPYGIYLVRWDLARTDGAVSPVGPFPFRERGAIHYPLQAGGSWIHAVELEAALEVYPWMDYTVLDGWVITPSSDARPFGWVEEMARLRIQAKASGQARHIPLKLGLNSLYGKCAQSPRDASRQPPFLSFYWAGLITARTRATMLRAASACGNGLVAIATDGLFTTTAPNVTLPEGKEPGTWEHNGLTPPLVVIQPGIMYSQEGTVVKTRGYGKATAMVADEKPKGARGWVPTYHPLGYADVLDVWNRDGPNGTLRYRERRFVGLGACAGHGNFAEYGRWLHMERKLSFWATGGKFYNDNLSPLYSGAQAGRLFENLDAYDDAPRSWPLVPTDYTGVTSQPYVVKGLADPELALYLAEREQAITLLEDQPDMYEDEALEVQVFVPEGGMR
jgi:hypothetical protein